MTISRSRYQSRQLKKHILASKSRESALKLISIDEAGKVPLPPRPKMKDLTFRIKHTLGLLDDLRTEVQYRLGMRF